MVVAEDGEKMSDSFNYGRLMQRALRGVMVEVLGRVAESGLPGEHHFFISFDVTHPGVDIPDWLRAEHPEELAIVLQHEFDDLAVAADRFSVTLSFSDRPATLVVPFDAVATFADPSEKFGLRFDAAEHAEDGPEDDPDDGAAEDDAPPKGDAEVVSLDAFRKR
jgi:hypothetical protein